MSVAQRDLFTGDVIADHKSTRKLAKRVNGRHNGQATCNCGGLAVQEMIERIASLEQVIAELREIITQQNRPAKESYSTAEIASILGRKPYTVREWCRLRRINADKAMCGRGCEEEWRVSHEELLRIQNEGLLPTPERY